MSPVGCAFFQRAFSPSNTHILFPACTEQSSPSSPQHPPSPQSLAPWFSPNGQALQEASLQSGLSQSPPSGHAGQSATSSPQQATASESHNLDPILFPSLQFEQNASLLSGLSGLPPSRDSKA